MAAPTRGAPNRWERGARLPPSDERRRGGRRDDDAGKPEDLWDDPTDGPATAAADFSAFGGSLDDAPRTSGGGGGLGDAGGFDLADMASATLKFEEESGYRQNERRESAGSGEEAEDVHHHRIDSHRPLASTGTEIRSGSGNNVNVFEDFGAPGEANGGKAGEDAIKNGGEKNTASSRLMEMIGVQPGTAPGVKGGDGEPTTIGSTITIPSSAVPINPWGKPVAVGGLPQPQTQSEQPKGMDLNARLADEQRKRQEEAKQRAEMQAREEQQRQQAAMQAQQQQQRQQQPPSQVELILVERVSGILENSWGRSDLISILSTLHSEDARVVPLLGNADALRALIARHPRRIQLAKDPAFGAEMAVLVLSNSQWQQAQAQEQHTRVQQDEMRRRQQMLAQQQQQQQQQQQHNNNNRNSSSSNNSNSNSNSRGKCQKSM